jgi:DNA polymerase-3 subunit epsilon
VIEKFSTLVNPERRIPSNITRLTGISDAMVADAPKFQEIAESFREFAGKAVFVAHNAQFDYGFLREEFRRLGQNFRSPTLCTVVATRKYFPGLPSYGLASLTHYFGIPLASHHRALCDAEATAELLILINGIRTRSI